MGLDISTLMHPRWAGPSGKDENGDWRDEPKDENGEWARQVWNNRDFPNHIDGRRAGFYFGEMGEAFCAGSYSGYNRVRADICRLAFGVDPDAVWADADRFRDEPIYPLINFSDCEGAIGPETSKRLADALDALAPRFGEMRDEWSETRAEMFRRAFRQAAESDGFVLFH